MNNYTGKTVYVGLDVHKHTYFATRICEGEVVKRDSLKASPETLVEYLQKHFPSAKIQFIPIFNFVLICMRNNGYCSNRKLKKLMQSLKSKLSKMPILMGSIAVFLALVQPMPEY